MTAIQTPRFAPLYAAGFVTAFGAHSVAAGAGALSDDIGLGLLNLGILLALDDVAEVILKPIFGALADRIGPKPVIVAGLMGFAAASLLGLWASNSVMLWAARLGQGAAAAAFSPASSAAVARLAGKGRTGTFVGKYGSWKSIRYTVGPLLGAVLIGYGGLEALFAVLAGLAVAVAVWVAVAMPRIEPLPKTRATVADLVRELTNRRFLVPTLALAASTAVLGAAIGFLPALASAAGAPLFLRIALASVLAVASAIVQQIAGRLRDQRRIADRTGLTGGLVIAALGVFVAALATLTGQAAIAVGLVIAALVIGAGVGSVAPFGFAALADSTSD